VYRLPNGDLHGVAAVIDKDRTSCLLAQCIGADALIMLTDIDGVYIDFKKPTQRKLDTIDVTKFTDTQQKSLLEQLPAGSMRPKMESALLFAKTTLNPNAFSAIGRMEDLNAILDGACHVYETAMTYWPWSSNIYTQRE
jgi:carbamate kinase